MTLNTNLLQGEPGYVLRDLRSEINARLSAKLEPQDKATVVPHQVRNSYYLPRKIVKLSYKFQARQDQRQEISLLTEEDLINYFNFREPLELVRGFSLVHS